MSCVCYIRSLTKYTWKGLDSIELIHFMGNAFENYLIKTNLLMTENHSTTRNGIHGLGCYHTIPFKPSKAHNVALLERFCCGR